MTKLPDSWRRAPIGVICDLVNGRAFKPSEWTDTGLPIIRIQNLNNSDATFNHYDGEVQDKFLINNGDLLFAWSGTPGTSFGAHVWTGGKAALNQHIFKVVFDDDHLDRDYFRYAINQKLQELIDKAHGGVGLRHVTKGKFEETEIELPPRAEQTRIVAKLDSCVVRTRRACEELDRVMLLIDRYKQAILSDAFGNSLETSTEETTAKPTVALSELIDDGPRNGWSPKSGGDARGALTLKLTATTSGELRLDDRAVKRIYDTPESDSRYWLEPGDILVQRANTIEYLGSTAIFDGPTKTYIYPDLMMRLRVSDEHIRCYLWRYLNSPAAREYFRDRATGIAGNMPKISGKILKSLPVPLPRDGNYQRVNDAIDHANSWVDVVRSDVARAKTLIGHLNREILSKAFQGDLVPHDPNDEPASLLLERIRDERQARPKSPKRTIKGWYRMKKSATKIQGGVNVMAKKRADVSDKHLSETLRTLGGAANAKELWQGSDMDIDEFYKQLRDEIKAGCIKEGSGKESLEITDAT